jgi:4-amino-4-deoxy-L-arabinose transferase-like glycosyltransferase
MTGPVGMAIGGALIGLLVGVTQSVTLAERFQNAWWWIAANTFGWTAGWVVIGLAESSVDSIAMTYLIGSLGAAVVGAITAIALIGLIRHPHPEPLAPPEINAEP